MARGTLKQQRQWLLASMLRATTGAVAQLSVVCSQLREHAAKSEPDKALADRMQSIAYLIQRAQYQVDQLTYEARVLSLELAMANEEERDKKKQERAQRKLDFDAHIEAVDKIILGTQDSL